jgi:putative FmdB family regulatory protein
LQRLFVARIILGSRASNLHQSNWRNLEMPIYEYECRKCKAHIEVFQKMSDQPPTKCRKCGGRLEKMFSAPAIQFKGSGWYVTDYADGGRKAAKAEESSAASEEKKSTSKEASPAKKTSDKATKPKSKES